MQLDVDDSPVSQEEAVRQARLRILQEVNGDWAVLMARYQAFREVHTQATERGAEMGRVLVALLGIARAVRAGAAAPPDEGKCVCSTSEADVVERVAQAYYALYTENAIVTAAQWRAAMRQSCGDGSLASLSASAVPVALRHHVRAMMAGGDGGDDGNAAEEDDGALAEKELRQFVRYCVQLGRKCVRQEACDLEQQAMTRDMIAALQHYLNTGDLEW